MDPNGASEKRGLDAGATPGSLHRLPTGGDAVPAPASRPLQGVQIMLCDKCGMAIAEDGCCPKCGVDHSGDPCPGCGRRGYHKDGCPTGFPTLEDRAQHALEVLTEAVETQSVDLHADVDRAIKILRGTA